MKKNKNKQIYIPALCFLIWYIVTFFMWFIAFPFEYQSEWLKIAQEVCFGSIDNGMPDAYGWIKLIFTPFFLLLLLYIIWKQEFFILFNMCIKNRYMGICIIILFSLMVAQGFLVIRKINVYNDASFKVNKHITSSLPITYPQINKKVPLFVLTDYNGKKFTNKCLKGKIIYLTFAFSKCSSICPLLINTVRNAVSEFNDREMVIISLDPWRETINNVKDVTKKFAFTDKEHYLVGQVDEIKELLDKFEIPRARNLKNGEIIHPGLVYVLDAKGEDRKSTPG